MKTTATIAIVGRPNVGKSTLFNRLIGKRYAIISKVAGTTRDPVSYTWEISGRSLLLVDTGGLEYGKKENIEEDVQSQANLAIADADIVLFIIDSIENLTSNDFLAADVLRKTKKPVIFVANKYDNKNLENNIYNAYELGFGDPIRISAIHNIGIDNLKLEIEKQLKLLKINKGKAPAKDTNIPNICILGKPNAGKSSLVNAFLGKKKLIVSEIPGTTRDTSSSEIEYNGKKYNLVDTAGLRRPGKIQDEIEKFSSLRCLNAIENSDIVVILIDGIAGVTHQDCHIAELALERDKGLIIAINKLDLAEDSEEFKNLSIYRLKRKFAFVPWAPVVFISAKKKTNIFKILDIVSETMDERKKRIETPELNAFLQKTVFKHLPASTKIKKPKFFYGTQAETNPPIFVLFFRNAENIHFSYMRYLENEIRKEYGFTGTAIQLRFKNSVSEKKKKSK